VWTRSDVKPRAEYLATLDERYHAHAQPLQFGDPSAAQAINAWTKAHTLGLIDRIVDRTSRDDFVYLTNALAFQANWTLAFKKSDTHPMPFTNAGGSKSTVQMMSQDGDFETGASAGVRVLRMPYGRGGFAAYILLPGGDSVEPLLKELSADRFDALISGLRQSFMRISVPRFTATYTSNLIPLLQSMGVTDAFTDNADFSGIHAVPPRLAITSVNHAAYVRVDEKGTTAAAATSVGISITAIRVPQQTFVVDHPFVLALRDEHTGALLFIGAVRTLKG
jgi:serpin B